MKPDLKHEPQAAPRWTTIEDTQAYLGGVARNTVRRMIANGAITAVRMPGTRRLLIDLNEVDRNLRPIPTAASDVA